MGELHGNTAWMATLPVQFQPSLVEDVLEANARKLISL